MPKTYEYKTYLGSIFDNTMLNEYGKEGWELVSTIRDETHAGKCHHYMKREVVKEVKNNVGMGDYPM